MLEDDDKCEFIGFNPETPEEMDKKYPSESIRNEWTMLEAYEQDFSYNQIRDLAMNKVFIYCDDTILGGRYGRDCILRSLTLLPKNVVNYVADKVIYLLSPENNAMVVPMSLTSGRKVIIVDSKIFARNARTTLFESHVHDILFLILHELAHCWLNHKGIDNDMIALDEDTLNEWQSISGRQEKEANEQVLEWIKEFDFYTEFRNKLVFDQL